MEDLVEVADGPTGCDGGVRIGDDLLGSLV